MRNIKGFTLIELMIVVAIIAILAALALPAYQDYVARAQMSEALTLASAQKTAVVEKWWYSGQAPSSNVEAGIADAAQINGRYVAQTSIGANGTITATMRSTQVASAIQGKRITLTPDFPAVGSSTGSINWKCSSDAGVQYVPSSCR